MKLVKVFLETRNFTFEAFGLDKSQAMKALNDGVNIHCKEYKTSEKEFWKAHPRRESVMIRVYNLEKAYRDGESLNKRG
jgi:hypothetical protein